MKNLTLPIIRKAYQESLGKTVIECNMQGKTVSVWVNGDKSQDNSLLCNVTVNEVGDTFLANRDSNTMIEDPKDKTKKIPAYLKGETVTRRAESFEFKSLTGNNNAAQFAQSAFAFGLQLNVIMG